MLLLYFTCLSQILWVVWEARRIQVRKAEAKEAKAVTGDWAIFFTPLLHFEPRTRRCFVVYIFKFDCLNSLTNNSFIIWLDIILVRSCVFSQTQSINRIWLLRLQEVLDIARLLLVELGQHNDCEIEEKKSKLEQLKTVLEMWVTLQDRRTHSFTITPTHDISHQAFCFLPSSFICSHLLPSRCELQSSFSYSQPDTCLLWFAPSLLCL